MHALEGSADKKVKEGLFVNMREEGKKREVVTSSPNKAQKSQLNLTEHSENTSA